MIPFYMESENSTSMINEQSRADLEQQQIHKVKNLVIKLGISGFEPKANERNDALDAKATVRMAQSILFCRCAVYKYMYIVMVMVPLTEMKLRPTQYKHHLKQRKNQA